MPEKPSKINASPVQKFALTIFLPIATENRDDLRGLGCAVYMPGPDPNEGEFPGIAPLTNGERNQLLSGARTVEQICASGNHEGDGVFAAEMENQAANCSTQWALSSAPTVPVSYGGSVVIESIGVGRINGWVASNHHHDEVTFFQHNYEGEAGDELILDSCSDDVLEILGPFIGTDMGPNAVIVATTLIGYVHVAS